MEQKQLWKQKLNLYRTGNFCWSIIRGVLIIGLCFSILLPIIIKVLQGFMSEADLLDPTVSVYPREWSTYFYRHTYELIQYPVSAWHSFYIALLTSAVQAIICPMIGYGLARFHFKGRKLLFGLIVATILVPPQLYSTSLYLKFRFFGIFGLEVSTIDTIIPFLILSVCGLGFKNGLYIYLLRQFFRGMPRELEEAAYIDGYGPIQTFFRIMLPNARNMLVTVLTLSFSWQWTDVFYSTLFNQSTKTLPLAILNNITQIDAMDQYVILRNTAGILTLIPLLIIFAIAQKQLISGIERSGIVG